MLTDAKLKAYDHFYNQIGYQSEKKKKNIN